MEPIADKDLKPVYVSLPNHYHAGITSKDRSILSAPIQELVRDVQSDSLSPVDILRCYGKVALRAHAKTNCLTEVMLPEAEGLVQTEKGGVNLQGPLAGIPVSVKDSIVVSGFDTSVGYSINTGQRAVDDGPMVKVLKAAGAVPFVKTNLPITLLSFESNNDVWGRCLNPHNVDYSPGGSTGGEAALLAFGGSRIGIGSDVAGSVRAPAHYSGCYSLKCSVGRWPKMGVKTSMAGQEGIPAVYSPMARTLNDLVYFSKSLIQTKPWLWDHTVHPINWRTSMEKDAKDRKVFKVGVLRTDGVIDPSPACSRALERTVSSLQSQGHEVKNVTPPSPYTALQIASQLLNSDGCGTILSSFRTGETNDAGAHQMALYMKIPRPLKYLYYLWVRYVRRDPIWADLLRHWYPKTAFEQWQWVAKREAYKALWHDWWTMEEIDFLVTPANATPACPHDGMKEAVSNCGYTFLFNLLDYTCGVIPVTNVDRVLDQLPATFRLQDLNGVAKGAYSHYDADRMHGLPVAVQIVGRRLEEEKILGVMERVEEALEKTGGRYELLDIE